MVWRIEGHSAASCGVANDGEPYENTYAWFMRMRDGLVDRRHGVLDSISFNDLWSRIQP